MIDLRIFAHGKHHDEPCPWKYAPPWAIELGAMIIHLIDKQEAMMATLADVTAAVARNTDAEDAALVYLKDIAQKLKDAIAANDPAALDALVASIDANTAKAAAAIVQGTN